MSSGEDEKMQFKEFSKKYKSEFENKLLSYISDKDSTTLERAMIYSLDAKGKRLRPLLLLAVLDSFGINVQLGYQTASAVEMVHTYSLIHDDLPAMDDDNLRRGKLTNHLQFSEATAILAGDALLTLAFEVITEGDLPSNIKLKLSKLLAETAGYKGMVGGQQADIEGEKSSLSLVEIESIHNRKTAELIKMSVVSGGLIAEVTEEILEKLRSYSKEIGIAYQIRDDLLDLLGSEEDLGKAVLSDSFLEKSTYPSILGEERAFLALNQHLEKARSEILSIKEIDSNFKVNLLLSFIDSMTLEEYK